MYALIVNNEIKVGPIRWSYSVFNSYLIENQLDNIGLPIRDPNQNVEGDGWRILRAEVILIPEYNENFQQLVGPHWALEEDRVVGSYTLAPQSISISKSRLKQQVTETRYNVEVGGAPFTLPDGDTVTLYTTREDRNTYAIALVLMQPEQTITFKFPGEVFKTVDKDTLQQMVGTGIAHIQAAFDWESSIHSQIDQAQTFQQLQNIDTNYPE